MNTQTPPDDLIAAKEAAKLLAVSIGTLRRWIAQGTLPAFRIGGRVRVSRADAQAMVQRVETGGERIETRREKEARDRETDRILRAAGVRK